MSMLRFLALCALATVTLFAVFLLKLAWAQPPKAQQHRAARSPTSLPPKGFPKAFSGDGALR